MAVQVFKVFMDWDNETGDVQITKPVTLEQGDFMAVVRQYLDDFGYDVVKREPELKACPNPECKCRKSVYVEDNTVDSLDGDYKYYYVLCDGCGYCSPEARTPEEAIRLHNLIADNALPRKGE